MRREDSKRRLSIFFLLLLILLVAVTWFALGWLEDTAKFVSERTPDEAPGDSPTDESPNGVLPDSVPPKTVLPSTAPAETAPPKTEPSDTKLLESVVSGTVLTEDRSRGTSPTQVPQPVVEVPQSTGSVEQKTRAPTMTEKYKDVVAAFRTYLDLDEDAWVGRAHVKRALSTLAETEVYPLVNMPVLRWVVAQARSFGERLTDRKWLKKQEVTLTDRRRHGFEVQGADLHMHVRLPPTYPKNNRPFQAYPRTGPWPAVVVLPTRNDLQLKEGPGAAWLARSWDPEIHADLYQKWCLCMPLAPDAVYSKGEIIDAGAFYKTMRTFWNRYHIDFDQLLIDGGQDALLVVTTNGAPFFAGLILRDLALVGGEIESDKLKASITNVHHLPIYVPDRPDIVRALRSLGCRQVTSGGGGTELAQWMVARRRHTPTRFRWSVVTSEQTLAYWVNIDSADWDSRKREIDVRVNGNTITIGATGIFEVSLFLNDSLVNLSERVKVVVNDKVVHDDYLKVKEPSTSYRRSPKIIFETRPVEVRRHRYYGWLQSGMIVRIPVSK